MKSLLTGVRVLDVAAFSPVKFGTMVLADLGADVIQVERPPASLAQDFAMLTSTEHPRWLWHSRNKRSVGIDLKSPGGQEAFRDLVATADIVVEGFAVGTAERLGIDYETLRDVKPDLIYASVSGFGQWGPDAGIGGHEPNYQALSGLTAATAGPDRPPALLPLPVGDSVASLYAMLGVIAALHARDSTGRGAHLDIPIQGSVLSLFGYNAQHYWHGGIRQPREIGEYGADPGSGVFETRDGRHVMVCAVEPWAWAKLCRVLGLDDLAGDLDPDPSRAAVIRERLCDAIASRSLQAWREINDRENVGITPVVDMVDLLERDPHVQARGQVTSVEHSTLGRVPQLGTPIWVDGSIPQASWMPEYGEHTPEVLSGLGYDEDRIARLREDGAVF